MQCNIDPDGYFGDQEVEAMANSKKNLAGKTANKQASASSPKTVVASVPSAAQSAPAKRKVMTSSEIEAAAQQPSAEAQKASPSPSPDTAKTPSDGASTKAARQAASSKTIAKGDESVVKTPVKYAASAGASEKNAEPAEPAKAAKSSSPSPAPTSKQAESAAKPSVATSGAARPAGEVIPPANKSTAPKSPTKSEKANTVSTKPKTTATSKSAASAAPKKKTVAKSAPKKAAAAPASTASKSAPAPAPAPAPKAAAPATSGKSAAPATVASEAAVSKPAATSTTTQAPSKSTAAAKPVDAKPKAEPKQGDVVGFGALFINGTGMEPYFELWKTPEVEAMVTAGNEAFEESVSAANEAFGKIFETMTGQADVFSGAGSRVAAQYEELLDTQKKSFEEVWQATMAMFEKTGGIGTELSTWMQKEFESSQDDLDELTKVENLADLQELHSRIVNRCYESSLAEGEKMQELMFSAFSDGLNAISKATNVTLK